MLTFITGGIKSGKSVFAEKLADNNQNNVYYVATAIVTDEEMQKRVDVHRSRRPKHWYTLEEKYDLGLITSFLTQETSTIIIDCITTLLTNRLWRDNPELFEQNSNIPPSVNLLEELGATAKTLSESSHQFIVVSNEVGLGLIPPTYIGRVFCDLQGKANQIFAEYAQEVYFIVSGIPIKIK